MNIIPVAMLSSQYPGEYQNFLAHSWIWSDAPSELQLGNLKPFLRWPAMDFSGEVVDIVFPFDLDGGCAFFKGGECVSHHYAQQSIHSLALGGRPGLR